MTMRENDRLIETSAARRSGQRGSALVIALLVTVILTLLGISFLMMGETESQIAKNDLRSNQALYAAEGGVRLVKTWFDHPGAAANLGNPAINVIDRTLRKIDEDGDPGTAPHDQDGSTWPRYKQGVDLDADGNDDVFDRPYRDDLKNTLLGTEEGPDVRIDESYSSGAKAFLMDISQKMLGDFPGTGGVRARITRIDVYAPPYVSVAGAWTRYGMATVKVIARIYRPQGTGEQVLAERMVKAVLNEIPFPGPFGPLHSCAQLHVNGEFKVHWGTASAVSGTTLPSNHKKNAASIPRAVPSAERLDKLWGTDAQLSAYLAAADGETVEDPWFRFLSGGTLTTAPSPLPEPNHPWPFNWDGVSPLADGQWPNHDHGSDDGTHSNIFAEMPLVTCPDFDYELWKSIATSGTRDVHYYVWDSGSSFKENGAGAAKTFRQITDNAEGLFFFDTTDNLAPHDDDGDGVYDNLTPAISLTGGTYGVRGFIYLNAGGLDTMGIGSGRSAVFRAPGEPYLDNNPENGKYDAGEVFVNLAYPTTIGGSFVLDQSDTYGGGVIRNSRGPAVNTDAVLWGILYSNGYFDATGNARYFGSVITKQGVGVSSPSAGTPDLYWDESILTDFPPKTWDLPRTVITRWETDL